MISFLGKATNCLGTINAVVLICLSFSKVFHAMPCRKLLISMEVDKRMPAMAKEEGVTCCAERGMARSEG